MNWNRAATAALPIALAGLLRCGGPTAPPRSLVEARQELTRAQYGPASQLDPAGVHEAVVALQSAERAWQLAPDDPSTEDLALIAHRKALLAQSHASVMKATEDARVANREAARLRSAQGEQLGVAEMQPQQGMVITLQAEVLFNTGESDLKPEATVKLDQIARELHGKDQPIVIGGFTDDVGDKRGNVDLSRRRADSVRDYLVGKGIPQDLMTAVGRGPDAPVADNHSIEGRAQNRRVEIVVQPEK